MTTSAMRIGILAPPWVPVPPPAYGGTEAVVDNLARALRARGHEVQMFTVGDSTCPVDRGWFFRSARSVMGDSTEEAAHVLAGYEALTDVDIIHDHTVLGPLVSGLRRPAGPPVVLTHHARFTPTNRKVLLASARSASIVAISRSHARSAGPVPIRAVIHHGLDLAGYQPGSGTGGYLLFIGRMSPDKGVDTAVRVAKRAGMPLIISSKMRTTEERAYYAEFVAPLLGPSDPPPQELPLAARIELLQGAAALVNPIRWPEPFGLVMIEALAAATPVITRPQGAAPEIVSQGKTGFLCESEEEMVAAVERLDRVDRHECRAMAERHFSADRMARDYEALFREVLDHPAGRRRSAAPTGYVGAQPSSRVQSRLDVAG